LNAAGKFGLATGKAYIDVSTSCRKTMSGFWFKERFFITCAHFMENLPNNAPSKENLVSILKTSGATAAKPFARQIVVWNIPLLYHGILAVRLQTKILEFSHC
jgi:hypothetical protein